VAFVCGVDLIVELKQHYYLRKESRGGALASLVL